MVALLEKTVLLVILFLCCLIGTNSLIGVIPILFVLSFSCIMSYFNRPSISAICVIIYAILSMFFNELILFFPAICYDILFTKYQLVSMICFIPIFTTYMVDTRFYCLIAILFFFFACYLKYRTNKQERLKQEYIKYRDTSKEFSNQLEQKNKELLEKQDYEINIATLNERNRIAMEIHDNVGHLLSSSILQIGAILASVQDNAITKNLETVNNTLSTAMNSIRNSVHNIHDESLQLAPQIQSIVDQFNFCKISLDNTITNNPNSKITYCFIAITKEALSNIMKHSNADTVTVTLREHPKLYQLKIQDNGSSIIANFDNGIGIKNMEHRVSSLKGNMTISIENGFDLFISIPKEELKR